MYLVLQIGFVALVVAVLWWAFEYAQAAFVVRIDAGAARIARGKVTAAFLQELEDACRQHRVTRGTVRGMRHGRRISLRFSGGIPAPCQQQLRNIWTMHAR